jgi:hypothetical protein
MLSSPSPLSCSHNLLAVSFSCISPLSRTEHISKYSSIESLWNYLSSMWLFIKNGVQIRELCTFYISVVCGQKLISGRVAGTSNCLDSGITCCRNLQLSWFLICSNHSFMGLINIQCFPFETTQNFDEISGFLRIDPATLMILIILSSRVSCCTSVLKI